MAIPAPARPAMSNWIKKLPEPGSRYSRNMVYSSVG
jgi:hypothetical protein